MLTKASPHLRSELLTAAAELLRTRGVRGLTTREIARQAGCSDGALYVHFAGKEELLASVCEQFVPDLHAAIGDLVHRVGVGDVAGNLAEIAEVVLRVYADLVPISLAIGGDPDLVAHRREYLLARDEGPHKGVDGIAAYLGAEQRLGRVAPGADLEGAGALLLSAAWFRVMHRQTFGRHLLEADDAAFVRRLGAALWAGLGPAPTGLTNPPAPAPSGTRENGA